MGVRKRISAEKMKESRKMHYFGKLKSVSTSHRKLRLVVNMIRGIEVFKALGILKFSNKEVSAKMEKLLKSVISNWEQKNGRKAENEELYVTAVNVDTSSSLKRMRPAPRGRSCRICKRFSHVMLYVDTKKKIQNLNLSDGTKSKSDK